MVSSLAYGSRRGSSAKGVDFTGQRGVEQGCLQARHVRDTGRPRSAPSVKTTSSSWSRSPPALATRSLLHRERADRPLHVVRLDSNALDAACACAPGSRPAGPKRASATSPSISSVAASVPPDGAGGGPRRRSRSEVRRRRGGVIDRRPGLPLRERECPGNAAKAWSIDWRRSRPRARALHPWG